MINREDALVYLNYRKSQKTSVTSVDIDMMSSVFDYKGKTPDKDIIVSAFKSPAGLHYLDKMINWLIDNFEIKPVVGNRKQVMVVNNQMLQGFVILSYE